MCSRGRPAGRQARQTSAEVNADAAAVLAPFGKTAVVEARCPSGNPQAESCNAPMREASSYPKIERSSSRAIMATRTNPSRTRPGRPRRALSPVGRAVQDIETNFDRDYWLAHCEGYRVDAEDGRLGFVEAVRADGSPDGHLLCVRAGRLGLRLLFIPVSQVALIVPRLERICLSGPVRVVEGEAFEPGSARSRLGRRDTTWS